MWGRAWAASLLCVAVSAGCAGEDEGPSPNVLADLALLHELIDRDPSTEPLELVERRLDDERPVHAAQMLRTTAIPAANRQVERIERAAVTSDDGRRFRRRLVAAYRTRVTALEAQQVVLEGGVGADPLEELTALRAVRQAEEGLLAIVRDMSALVPRPEPSPGSVEGEEEGELEEGQGGPGTGGQPAPSQPRSPGPGRPLPPGASR